LGTFSAVPSAVHADDPDSKISGSLALTIADKLNQARPLRAGPLAQAPLIQGESSATGSVKVFIYLDEKPDAARIAELAALGITAYPQSWIPPVGSHPKGFITADVPVSDVEALAERDYVARIDSAEVVFYPQNDVAAQTVNAQSYWTNGYNGAGVKVAVLDSGLDTTHPDIPVPVAKKDYSYWPVLGDNITSPVWGAGAHGTHVTGSLLGRGTLSGGRYKGIAYGADLVFIKIGDNTTAGASWAAMTNALRDAADVYGANIISMSYSGWGDHHDGSSATCQAADYAVSKGSTVFLSAGNNGNTALHYSGTVAAGATTGFIQIDVTGSNGANCTLMHNLVWYDGPGAHDNLTMQYYDAAFTLLTNQSIARTESFKGTEQQYWYWGPNPGVVFWVPAGSPTYYVKVTNTSASDRQFHLYFRGTASGGAKVRFNTPDPYYTQGDPSEADSAISVGSYNSRTTWIDYQGNGQTTGYTLNDLSPYSSRGPRVDPTAPYKPWVVAPGSAVISCRDRVNYPLGTDSISNNGVNNGLGPADYMAWSGTSMACPIAAGATALLMQSNPALKGNPMAVRTALAQYGSRSANPDNIWGYGLLVLPGIQQQTPITPPAVRTLNMPQSSAASVPAPVILPVSLPNVLVQSASISQAATAPGEPVIITAYVANHGSREGSALIKLLVNGSDEEVQGITIPAGRAKTVRFELSRNVPGVYSVAVNNVSAGSFVVQNAMNETAVFAVIGFFIIAITVVSVMLWRRLIYY
ncbi:MAG: S8 family serine peptidase, partial [Dehalococcoidia bacterium]|nr:S8 family serine peptidase [Dehalococcoidia bacterium]